MLSGPWTLPPGWTQVTEVYHLSLRCKHVASKDRGWREIHLPNVMHLSGFSLSQLRRTYFETRRCPTSLVGGAETLYPHPSRILRVQVVIHMTIATESIKGISQVGRNWVACSHPGSRVTPPSDSEDCI